MKVYKTELLSDGYYAYAQDNSGNYGWYKLNPVEEPIEIVTRQFDRDMDGYLSFELSLGPKTILELQENSEGKYDSHQLSNAIDRWKRDERAIETPGESGACSHMPLFSLPTATTQPHQEGLEEGEPLVDGCPEEAL